MKFLKTLPLLSVLFSGIVVAGDGKGSSSAPTPTASGQKKHGKVADRAKHFEVLPPVEHPTQSLVGVPGEGRGNVRGRGSKAADWEKRTTQPPLEPQKQAPTVGRVGQSLLANAGSIKFATPGSIPGGTLTPEKMRQLKAAKEAREAETQSGQFDNPVTPEETPVVQSEGTEHFSAADPHTEESARKSVADLRRAAQFNPLSMAPGAVPPKKTDASEPKSQLLTNEMAKRKPRKPSSKNRPTTSKIVVPNSRPETSSVVAPVVHSLAPLDDVVESLECVPTEGGLQSDSSLNMGGGHGMFLEGPGIDDLFAPRPTPAPKSTAPAPFSSLNDVASVPTTASLFEVYQELATKLRSKINNGPEFNALYKEFEAAYNAYMASKRN